jgi:hypothetical protein
MRARHLNTLEAFLKEYSGAASGQQPVKPGNQPASPVGSGNQAHDNADVNKANRDAKAAGLPKDATNTELQSKADAGWLPGFTGCCPLAAPEYSLRNASNVLRCLALIFFSVVYSCYSNACLLD